MNADTKWPQQFLSTSNQSAAGEVASTGLTIPTLSHPFSEYECAVMGMGRVELEVRILSGSGYRFEDGDGFGFRFGGKV